MPLNDNAFGVVFEGCSFGVSARRIHEHMALGQINPFGRLVSSVRSLNDAAELIDVVRFDKSEYALTGLTLAGLEAVGSSRNVLGKSTSVALQGAVHEAIRAFVARVEATTKLHALRRAARNVPSPFLPTGNRDDPFSVPMLRSRLCDHLALQAKAKATTAQWLGTIRNLAQKGIRSDELQRSGLIEFLGASSANSSAITGKELAQVVDFSALRLSVIANISAARTQLRFEKVPEQRLAKIKEKTKPQVGQIRKLDLFDRVMGYRIEGVRHSALWGQDWHWQAIAFDGTPLRNPATRRAIFDSEDAAIARAQNHARTILPKLLASDRWAHWSWTGGQEYREWLITLPNYPESYFSSHFDVRNVLAHVRCDLREGNDGERVLMLHEIQSDWAQQARRAIRDLGEGQTIMAKPPFLQEWPALTLKLMLLHAAHLGVDALGWTRGAHQVHRWEFGEEGLRELYDRTLPREAKRMLKPFGMTCETIEVYVPENFKIRRIEGGFEVSNAQVGVLGVAPTFQAARDLMPDGAHERLYAVHGVRLSEYNRAAILGTGFAAWG